MRIIIKPMGAVLLCGVAATIATLAFRSKSSHLPIAVAAVAVAAPEKSVTRPRFLYHDGFENNWEAQGWSWAKQVVYDDPQVTFRYSATAIRAEFLGFDGIKFHHTPLETRAFNRFTFYVFGGARGGQRLQVGAESDGAAGGGQDVHGLGVHLPPLPANRWVSVTVPMCSLKMDKHPTFSSLWIQGDMNTPQPPVWIDEVRLLTPGEPAPSGDALDLKAL